MPNRHNRFRCLARRTLKDYLKVFRKQTVHVRAGRDIEAIHDLRVASRRLRSALAMFAPCLCHQANSWSDAIRKVTRKLGRARDLDVQIDFLKHYLATDKEPADEPGLHRLLLRLTQHRHKAQTSVDKALRNLKNSGTLPDLARSLENAGRAYHGCCALPAHIRKTLLSLLKDMHQYEPYLPRPQCLKQHHQMRIAAKHLRYAMEVFRDLGAGRLDPAIDAAREVQSQLGQMHDCDVWVEFLPAFLDRERRRTIKYLGDDSLMPSLSIGIQHLRRDRQRRRVALHAKFVKQWARMKGQRTWKDLQAALSAGPDSRKDAI